MRVLLWNEGCWVITFSYTGLFSRRAAPSLSYRLQWTIKYAWDSDALKMKFGRRHARTRTHTHEEERGIPPPPPPVLPCLSSPEPGWEEGRYCDVEMGNGRGGRDQKKRRDLTKETPQNTSLTISSFINKRTSWIVYVWFRRCGDGRRPWPDQDCFGVNELLIRACITCHKKKQLCALRTCIAFTCFVWFSH